jgi:hypothetical protein
MMAYEMKEGSGKLFKNDKKQKKEDRDYQGSIMINGTEHWLSAWVNEGKNGKYFSVSVGKPKEQKNFKPRGDDEMPKIQDDEIPF